MLKCSASMWDLGAGAGVWCTCRAINPAQNKINSLKRDFFFSVILLKLLNYWTAGMLCFGWLVLCLGFSCFGVFLFFFLHF